MSNIGCLMWGINLFLNLSRKYGIICADPERKQTTVYFGIYAIITSILTCALFALCAWGVCACLNAMGGELADILLIVFIVMLCIVMLTLITELIVGGLMGIVYQFRCNRRPIGWIALAVLVISVAGLTVGLIYIMQATGWDL